MRLVTRAALTVAILLPFLWAGCAAGPEVGGPPEKTSYGEWGAKLEEIPEIYNAGWLCKAALVHHRNANLTQNREKKYEDMNMALTLLKYAAEQLYTAWNNHPEYEKFIVMEIDKIHSHIHACMSQKPYYFDVTDPINVQGGALTYEQQLRVQQYQYKLRRWTQPLK